MGHLMAADAVDLPRAGRVIDGGESDRNLASARPVGEQADREHVGTPCSRENDGQSRQREQRAVVGIRGPN
jgi:hypothetical protein